MVPTGQRTHPDGLKVKSRVQVGLSPIRKLSHRCGADLHNERRTLDLRHAAINADFAAVHEAGVVGGEK